jgi:hypothetical protein
MKQMKSVARSVTAPARNYINNHFEMTKSEVRSLVPQIASVQVSKPAESMSELADVINETSLFQSRMIADTRAEVAEIRAQIGRLSADVAELSALVDRVVDVVGSMNLAAELSNHSDIASTS